MFRVFIIFLCLFNFLDARNNPLNWPWRGVNIPVDILQRESNIISELSKANVNAVRIHVNYKKFMKYNHQDTNKTLNLSIKMMDDILNKLAEYNMTGIIGVENFPQVNLRCKDKLNLIFWKTKECITEMYRIANMITSHFKDRGEELSAYQFISEPVVVINGKPKRPENWFEIQNKLLKIVEQNDLNRFLIITPGPWGMPQGYKNFKPLRSKKIIYNAHFFQPQQYTHQGIKNKDFGVSYPSWMYFRYWDKEKLESISSDLKAFQKRYDVPILIGSFSKVNWINDNNQWLKDSLSIFEKNNWGWLYFIVGADPWYGWDPRYEGDYKTKKFIYCNETKVWKLLKENFMKNKKMDNK